MPRLICLSPAIAIFCCSFGITPVHAATTHWVNVEETLPLPPGNGCEHAGYTTIQAAVNAASAGDTVRVCRGTYNEQVTIPGGKNNLTLHWAAEYDWSLAQSAISGVTALSPLFVPTARGGVRGELGSYR